MIADTINITKENLTHSSDVIFKPHICPYIYTSGKFKGKQCTTVPKEGTYCYRHKIIHSIKEPLIEKEKTEHCMYIYKRGSNKNKYCTTKPSIGSFCYAHTADNMDKQNIYVKKVKIDKTELENKIKYYQQLAVRLLAKTTPVHNENYTKPCQIFSGNNANISVIGKPYLKHRVAYAIKENIFVEDIPNMNDDGEILQVCHGHDCDKKCVEPSHFSLKTASENNYEDKIRDGVYETKDNDNSQQRKTEREKLKELKKQNFTDGDYEEAKKRIQTRIIESDTILSDKVDTPCHLFQGCLKEGYGYMRFQNIHFLVHVLAFEAKIKSKKDEKMVIRHLCDIKHCCNPEHLELGTRRENALDTIKYNKSFKMNEEKVKEIRMLSETTTMTQKEIAKKFDINDVTVSNIVNRKTWKQVK
jgi:hypothetical protein